MLGLAGIELPDSLPSHVSSGSWIGEALRPLGRSSGPTDVSRWGKNAQKRAELAQGGYSSRLGLAISTSLGSSSPSAAGEVLLTAPSLLRGSGANPGPALILVCAAALRYCPFGLRPAAAQEDYNRIVSYAE
jgi:hypothetical protein